MRFCVVFALVLSLVKGFEPFTPSGDDRHQETKLERMIKKVRENEDIWEAIGELQTSLNLLEANMDIQATEVLEMKTDIDEFDTDLKQVEAKIEVQHAEISALQEADHEFANDISGVRSDISGIRQDVEDHNTAVSFTASTDSWQKYSNGDRLVFPKALSNVGSHYSTSTGEFTCPHKGVYLFNADLMRDESEGRTMVVIRTSSSSFTTALVDVRDKTNRGTGVMSIFECGKDEKVWLEATFENCVIYGYSGSFHSVFSGVLIRRLD